MINFFAKIYISVFDRVHSIFENTFLSKNFRSNTQAMLLMIIVRIDKVSFSRLKISWAFEMLQAGSSLYKVAWTLDVAQRTLSKLMAIYRENVLSDQGGQNKTRQIYTYLKTVVHPLKKKYQILGNNMVR